MSHSASITRHRTADSAAISKLQAKAHAHNKVEKRKILEFVDANKDLAASESIATGGSVELEAFLFYSVITVLLFGEAGEAAFEGKGVAFGAGDFDVVGGGDLNRSPKDLKGDGYVTVQAGGVEGGALHVAMYLGSSYVGYLVCAGVADGAVPYEKINGTWK